MEEVSVSTESVSAPAEAMTSESVSPEAVKSSSEFVVPDEYKDRGWASRIKSTDDLFKSYDNAQSMLGKRPEGIPAKDASAEDWEKFYTAMGRPESADGYKFETTVEGFDGIDLAPHEAKARGFFHELGLPQDKANAAWNRYLEMELEGHKEAEAQLDEQFNGLTAKMFGDRSGEVLDGTAAFLQSVATEDTQPALQMVQDNPAVAALMMQAFEKMQSDIKGVKEKYGAEDNLVSGGEQVAARTQEDIRAEMMEQRRIAKTSGVFSSEREKAEARIAELRALIK